MRTIIVRAAPLLALAVIGGGVALSISPGAATLSRERRDRLDTARPAAALRLLLPEAAASVELGPLYQFLQGVAEREFLEGLASTQVVNGGRAGTAVVSASSGSCAGDVACFLACTRAHESDSSGGYGAVSPGGTYRGAYQFNQATWDAAVAGAGHDEYAGVPADEAPPEIQDAAAAHLYTAVGNRPWGGRC